MRAPSRSNAAWVAGAVPVLRSVVTGAHAGSLGLESQGVSVPAPADLPAAAARSADEWFVGQLPVDGLLVVPAGVHLVGNCRATSVLVEGRVDGWVRAEGGPLVIAAEGRVMGRVEGRGPVVVAGCVRAPGDGQAIVSQGQVALACTARVRGCVQAPDVVIYQGASVDGSIVRR